MHTNGDPMGSQNIMVTAMFGDSVLKVRQLLANPPSKGKGAIICRVLQATGAAVFLVGVVYAVMSQVGLATVLMLMGLGQVVFATTRLRLNSPSPHFTLGPAKEADLHMAHPAIPHRLFPAVQRAGDQHYLWFTDAMDGHVDMPGAARIRLGDLVPSGRAHPVDHLPGTHAFPIPRDARMEVEVGDNVFLVNSVSPATGGDRDVSKAEYTQMVDRIREQVRLAEGLGGPNKNIGPEPWARAIECLGRFGERVAMLPAGSVRAVGPNTLRKAHNARRFLAAARRALGHDIEIVSGREEARLIFLGVAHAVDQDAEAARRLVVDIGGGSTELIVGDRFTPLERDSVQMGCISWRQRW